MQDRQAGRQTGRRRRAGPTCPASSTMQTSSIAERSSGWPTPKQVQPNCRTGEGREGGGAVGGRRSCQRALRALMACTRTERAKPPANTLPCPPPWPQPPPLRQAPGGSHSRPIPPRPSTHHLHSLGQLLERGGGGLGVALAAWDKGPHRRVHPTGAAQPNKRHPALGQLHEDVVHGTAQRGGAEECSSRRGVTALHPLKGEAQQHCTLRTRGGVRWLAAADAVGARRWCCDSQGRSKKEVVAGSSWVPTTREASTPPHPQALRLPTSTHPSIQP